jgi:hypothetical protein
MIYGSGRRRRFGAAWCCAISLAAIDWSCSPAAIAQVNVTTQQNDIARTGQNLGETILTTSNVNPAQFGKVFVQPVTGPIYAQPLYLSGVTINGAIHNVVYVATRSDYIYAFDADSNNGANASPLWSVSLLGAAYGAAAGAQLYGGLGITSTPVIDPVSGTLYVVGATFEGGQVVYRLHALDVTSGLEKFGGPVTIAGSVAGTASDSVSGVLTLTPRNHNQRAGLLLLNGVVYIGFGSNSEGEDAVWHGWIFGYGASSLAQTGIFCVSPNGTGGGLWMSGEGLAADQLDPVNYPYGRMFVATGNGDFTGTVPYAAGMDFGDSVVDLNLAGGDPTVTDDFTPSNQASLFATDGDQGAGGALLLPTQTTGSYPNLLVQAGKSGTVYLLDRDNLGGYSSSVNQAVQVLPLAVGVSGPNAKTGVWSSPAYWNGNVYYWGVYDNLKSFSLVGGLLSTTPTTSTEVATFPSSTPSISANGATQGIVWTILGTTSNNTAVLLAHNAANVATTLYSSATNASRDTAGPKVGFTVPTIANGMVYVGTGNQLDVYGLINAAQTSLPAIVPGSQTFAGSTSVTITDATPNAVIYYTTDGSAPSTASTVYSGPISVTSSQTINAVAAAPGLALSNQSAAAYTIAATSVPTFSPAAVAYSSAVPVTISDATTGALIYYTTDGTTPTTASSVYVGPVTVSATQTINAIAQAPGHSASTVGFATYEIAGSSTILVNNSTGFSSLNGLNPVGTVTLTNNALQMSVAGAGLESNAIWNTAPLNVQAFTTDFYFQEASAAADGFTFTLQNSPAGLSALGSGGSGLGYQGLASSVAVKFDLFDNMGEGVDSTGFYANGASPTIPALDMTTSGVNLHGADILHANITYDGTTLTLTLSDTVTSASFTASTNINIPNIVGGNTAYAGFTAGASGMGATQSILNWTYVAGPGAALVTATPTFSPSSGGYAGPQWVSIADATAGAVIYYTINGTPTIASPVYSAPIAVSSNETISAIAAANGYLNSEVGSATYQFAPPAPTFTPPAGTYSSPQSVVIGDAISGTTIHYTTNGTKPTTSSTVYSSPISVSANETLEAIALASGVPASAVGTARYSIRAAAPTFSPAAGKYSSAQQVTISDANSGAVIYYTTDGSVPTTSSAVYSGPISVSADETLRAIAASSGDANSLAAAATYTIQTATPTFSPAAGKYSSAQQVTISDANSGAVIYYTTNGSMPTTSSAVYSGPITVSADETLKAIATISGNANSPAATATYTIQTAAPTFSPAAGKYSSAQQVTISDANSGAAIYYTTDGLVPTTSSAVYSGPITVSADETLKAIATISGDGNSAVAEAVYTIQAASPTFTPAEGTYSGAQEVTISDANSGAVIYYTTNGSVPTTSSAVYSGPITVSADETLKAIAAISGNANSPVAAATYHIRAPTPTFTPAAGTYSGAQEVTISDAIGGATIYYTTDGTLPTTSSVVYSGPITVSAKGSLKAIAVAAGYSTSLVGIAFYHISP